MKNFRQSSWVQDEALALYVNSQVSRPLCRPTWPSRQRSDASSRSAPGSVDMMRVSPALQLLPQVMARFRKLIRRGITPELKDVLCSVRAFPTPVPRGALPGSRAGRSCSSSSVGS